MLSLVSTSPEETFRLGAQVGQLLLPGDVLNLNGSLGAGKTLLVKGIGTSLNIPQDFITSPTFTLINEYDGTYPLYHFDVYRLEQGSELEDIGYEEYYYGSGITVVEWGNLFPNYLPDDRLDIVIERLGEQERKIEMTGIGTRGTQIVNELRRSGTCTY